MKEGEKVENDRNPLGVKIVLCDLNEFIREYYRFSYVLLSVVSGRVVCWLSFISLFHMRLSTKPPQKTKKTTVVGETSSICHHIHCNVVA